MSFFNDFPHVRQYDGDLGWLIRTVQDLASTLENFVNLNTIKYADPIAWNIATQYEANTVVINSADGTAYLSTRPVPSGVSVTDTEYWTPIFNYGTSLDQIRAQIAALNEGSSSTASQAVTAGQLLWLDGELYQAAYDIAAGTAYISGVNVNPVTVETILNAFRTYVESAVASITKPILNVKEYGATGGGTIDDTEAIQTAIDDAEANGYAVHIPSGTYLVSTLWIRSDIHIFGTGKLKAYPLRYDTLAANTSAGSNTITVSDGSIYRKNMILTIKKSTSTEVMVVTGISGNELTIKKFRYYDGLSGTDYLDNAYPTGSEIHINTVPLVITRHLYTEAVDSDDSAYIINNCRIEGISVTGNRSGYDHSKYSIYDITLNGCIFAYRTRGLAISGGSYGSCYNNAIAIIGRTAATKVERTIIENVQVPSDISDISLKDVGGGILLH